MGATRLPLGKDLSSSNPPDLGPLRRVAPESLGSTARPKTTPAARIVSDCGMGLKGSLMGVNFWFCLSFLCLSMPLATSHAEEPYPGGHSPVSSRAEDRAEQALARVRPLLQPELTRLGLQWGNPVYLRAFKQSAEMELWMQPEPGLPFIRVRNYRVAAASGELGPKLAEGDGQTPEGFYEVTPGALNPRSNYHLSFNIGYPNAYDRAHRRTGSFIMVHGSRVSIGCFAMTNDSIEQIYSLVAAAFERGQTTVPIHCFPFRMPAERMAEVLDSPWFDFWSELHGGYIAFESTRLPPVVQVRRKRYVFQ